ncbi:uncharacterized protein VTP21DRAFT_8519 [Calcarisporiella thermophila]|uniref:uncharacterized protein n=1 Tax=Calcarisporiella thermophila TaxID=911321 RepID=UPI003743CCB0
MTKHFKTSAHQHHTSPMKAKSADTEKEYASIKAHLHPEDSRDKVFSAVLRALLEMGNRPSSPRELANYILKHDLTQLGGQTPFATVSSRISQHYKRAAEHRRQPVLGRLQDEQRGKKFRYYIAEKESNAESIDSKQQRRPPGRKVSTPKLPPEHTRISGKFAPPPSHFVLDGEHEERGYLESRKRPATPPPSPPHNKRRMYEARPDPVWDEENWQPSRGLEDELSDSDAGNDYGDDYEQGSPKQVVPFLSKQSTSSSDSSNSLSDTPNSPSDVEDRGIFSQQPLTPTNDDASPVSALTSTDLQDSDYYEEMMHGDLGCDEDFFPYNPPTKEEEIEFTSSAQPYVAHTRDLPPALKCPANANLYSSSNLEQKALRPPYPLRRASVPFTAPEQMAWISPKTSATAGEIPCTSFPAHDFSALDELPDWADLNDPEKVSAADLDQYDQFFNEAS